MDIPKQMDKPDREDAANKPASPEKKHKQNIVGRFFHNDLKIFRGFQVLIACTCILIPLLLRICDKDEFYPNKPEAAKIAELGSEDCGYDPDTTSRICKDKFGFRTSLSDYVYSSNSYIFGMLYCMAAMLFMFNGAVFFKSQKHLQEGNKGKWYNLILGLFLLFVIINPPHERPFWHYLFTILFFVGNIFVIAFWHNRKNRVFSISLAILTVAALILALIPPRVISILLAEWISLAAIGFHLILEALASKPDRNANHHDARELHHRLHAGFTVAIPIREGESQKLEQTLEKFAAGDDNFVSGLDNSKSTLFVSCVILSKQTYDKGTLPPTLVFATTFSGPFRIHLQELMEENHINLCTIFQHCEKFPADAFCNSKKLKRYLRRRRHLHTFNSRYNCKTKSVIKKEKVLVNKIEEYLDSRQREIDFNSKSAVEVKSMIKNYIDKLGPDFLWAKTADNKSLFEKIISHKYKYPLILLAGLIVLIVPTNYMILLVLAILIGILMVVVLGIGVMMYITRKNFPTAPRPADDHVRALAASQLRPVLNEMTAAAPLKCGVTRMFFFVLALRFVQNFTRSRLEVPTVSNIRWLVVNKWKRLLFLSSYTNTTDFYVREFLTGSTPSGVNFMFTNGLGFPDARLLFEGGISEDPEGYMNVIHTHQHITNLWYAHDYNITVDIINKNATIRNGLFKEMNEQEARNWLMLL